MQENYTNPEQAGQGQNPQDLLNASLIFARALGLILKDSEGIVVDTKGDIKLREDVKKVIGHSYFYGLSIQLLLGFNIQLVKILFTFWSAIKYLLPSFIHNN